MKNVSIAFFAGVLFTAAVFFFIGSPAEDPAVAERVEQLQSPTASAQSPTPVLEGDQDVLSDAEVVAAGTDRIASEVVPLSVPIPITTPPTPRLVMPDGTEVQAGFENDLHSEIEREPIDSGWASVTEAQILDFYMQNAVLAGDFDYPSIQCRSTLCLIQVVDDNPESPGIWGPEMRRLFEQPWGSQFGRLPVGTRYYLTPEGQTAMLMYLRKRDAGSLQPQSEARASSAI